ncbi:MAG: hypothetical protein H7269_03295 [Cellulomonas sp.]|nr:hypothetical protein [Cellulomonas sp.]
MIPDLAGLSDYDLTFGFWLNRFARDGAQWIVSRYAPARGYPGHGIAALEVAGGATDRFAVLGWYRPVLVYDAATQLLAESGPDRGIIQAFKP